MTVVHANIFKASEAGLLGDSLQVDDGKSFKSSHDQSTPWTFLSSGPVVRVRFETDSQDTGEGFYLTYERGNGVQFLELFHLW